MYLRPGNLFKDFFIERNTTTLTPGGRSRSGYDSDGTYVLAVLANASTREIERFRQLEHPITHTIVHKGKPLAAANDRLIHGSRVFYIQGVDEPGDLGLWTIYYAEERGDLNAELGQQGISTDR